MAAAAFKQGCLALLDRVAQKHIEIVVTKRGKPVAKVVPVESPTETEEAILRELRGKGGTLVTEEELLQPTSRLVRWKK